MAMTTRRPTTFLRAIIAGSVIVIGLAASADRITAASAGAPGIGSGLLSVDALKWGQPVLTQTAIDADDYPGVFTRAASARDALGFPAGAKRAGKHVRDGFLSTEYDQVDEVDVAGQPLVQIQLDSAGLLVSAVRFDFPSGSSAKVSKDAAARSAARGLSASGIAVTGPYQVDANPALGGWDVHWDRSQAGFRVRGDETRVHVWDDGRVQAAAHVEHKLAAPPGRRLGAGDAKKVVIGQLDRWFAGRDSGYQVQEMDLEWVEPNAAFDARQLSAAPASYRLAWVTNVKPTGTAADYLYLLTVYVDAADGTLLGGDIVR